MSQGKEGGQSYGYSPYRGIHKYPYPHIDTFVIPSNGSTAPMDIQKDIQPTPL